MSSDYEPSIGDRVRVILEGYVTYFDPSGEGFDVSPDVAGFDDGRNFITPTACHVVSVEKIEPPLPSAPGSVLRYTGSSPSILAGDDLRIRGADGQWRDCSGNVLYLGPSAVYDVLLDTGATV